MFLSYATKVKNNNVMASQRKEKKLKKKDKTSRNRSSFNSLFNYISFK